MTESNYNIVVTPSSASTSVWNERQCVYSVSIGAANTTIGDLLDSLVWTKARFSRVAILVGDSLYAVTLRIQRGLDESESYESALATADGVIHSLEQSVGPLYFIRTSGVACDEIESAIDHSYTSVPEFAESIDADARAFVRRQARNNRLAVPVQLAESLARRYLIREVSIYAYLASQGWLIDVYLGRELPTLARIIDGTVPAVSRDLARRINISLDRKVSA